MSDSRPHDASYRRLFAHKPMIEDLLRNFARGPWLERFDFDSLEPVPTHQVAEKLEQRQEDMIWRLRYQGPLADEEEPSEPASWFYVYVLVEFQSSVDRFMALRMLVYVGLLYQHLVRQKDLTENRQLPPVLPIVLYNGGRSWSAPTQLADLIADAEGLDSFRPRFEFLLLDEGRILRERLESLDSPVAAMFEIEQSHDPGELTRVVDKLCRLLADEELAEVRRDFATWLKRLIVPARFAEFELTELEQLEEFRVMIEERVKEWTRQWEAEGYQRGIEDGLEKALRAQMELKFGSLAATWSRRLESASPEQLKSWESQDPHCRDPGAVVRRLNRLTRDEAQSANGQLIAPAWTGLEATR